MAGFARNAQQTLSRSLFWLRRKFMEPTLDARLDSVVLPVATYSPWLADDEFLSVYAAIESNTLVDMFRCWELWHLVSQVAAVEGDLIEVGVWRGGTGALLACRMRDLRMQATLHLCDTFVGVVKTSETDGHYTGGEHADTSTEIVESLTRKLNLNNTEIHVGIFPESANRALTRKRFRLAHIDVDAYESARDVFEWIWHRLNPGGIVVFDDFGFSTTRGVAKLCHELESISDSTLIQNLNGHAILVKVAS